MVEELGAFLVMSLFQEDGAEELQIVGTGSMIGASDTEDVAIGNVLLRLILDCKSPTDSREEKQDKGDDGEYAT